MKLQIDYSKASLKLFKKNHQVLPIEKSRELFIKATKRIIFKETTNIDLKALKGKYEGMYRIRKGDIRIIFTLKNGEIILIKVINIDFRGSVYNN